MPQTSISQHCRDPVRIRQADQWGPWTVFTPVLDWGSFLLSHRSIREMAGAAHSRQPGDLEHFGVSVIKDIIRALRIKQPRGSSGNGKGPEPPVWIDCFSTETMWAGGPWQPTILSHCCESVTRFLWSGKHRVLRNRGNLSQPSSFYWTELRLPPCLFVCGLGYSEGHHPRNATFPLWDIIFSLTFIGFLSVPSKCGALLKLVTSALIGRNGAGVKTLSLHLCGPLSPESKDGEPWVMGKTSSGIRIGKHIEF